MVSVDTLCTLGGCKLALPARRFAGLTSDGGEVGVVGRGATDHTGVARGVEITQTATGAVLGSGLTSATGVAAVLALPLCLIGKVPIRAGGIARTATQKSAILTGEAGRVSGAGTTGSQAGETSVVS